MIFVDNGISYYSSETPTKERSTMKRVLHFPATRIFIGATVCWIVLLGTNSILRLVLSSEGDIARVIRWLLSTLVLVAAYQFLFRRYENRAITELAKTGLIRESLVGLFTGTVCIAVIIVILYTLGYYGVCPKTGRRI